MSSMLAQPRALTLGSTAAPRSATGFSCRRPMKARSPGLLMRPAQLSDFSEKLLAASVCTLLWNIAIFTLALLVEINRGSAPRKKRRGEEPIPKLIPSIDELGWGALLLGADGEEEPPRPWSPSKDDVDEGILRSEESLQAEATFTPTVAAEDISQSLTVYSGTSLPQPAEMVWGLLRRAVVEESDRKSLRLVLRSMACSPGATEKYWKRKAALLLTLTRLGGDPGSMVSALLQDIDTLGLTLEQLPQSHSALASDVAKLLEQRKAVGDLAALFYFRALGAPPESSAELSRPASAQLLRELFVQSCVDSRPVLLELADMALQLAEAKQRSDSPAARALARSSLEFHAPIARSLGYAYPTNSKNIALLPVPHCHTLPATLEHFGLGLLYPSEYKLVVDWFDREYGLLDQILMHGTHVVKVALDNDRAFNAVAKSYKVCSRVKTPQSLMKKLLRGKVVNDLLGLEVIIQPRELESETTPQKAIKGEASCFAAAAGIRRFVSNVENGWTVAPKSFKNYVTKPKKSGYQALHLTLVTDFYASALTSHNAGLARRRMQRAPCQLELHIFTERMKMRERQGPASHAAYKAFPMRPEALMEALGNDEGIVSINSVAEKNFETAPDATHKLEELAHRAGYGDMDIGDLRHSREHVDEVVSAFQDLMDSKFPVLPEPRDRKSVV